MTDSVMEGCWVVVGGIQQSVRVVAATAANNRSVEPVVTEVVVNIHQGEPAVVVEAVRILQQAEEVMVT